MGKISGGMNTEQKQDNGKHGNIKNKNQKMRPDKHDDGLNPLQ